MKVSSDGFEILFTLNKGSLQRKCEDGDPDPNCASPPSFMRAQGDSFFCVEDPNCVGPNCHANLLDCEAAEYQQPLYYCVTFKSGDGVCCGSAVEGGWLCLNHHSGSVGDCASQDHLGGRTVFFVGSGCEVCDSLPVQYSLPYGPGEQQLDSSVFKVPVWEFDPLIHEVVSGPVTFSESCVISSSFSSDQAPSSSSSVSVVGSSSSSVLIGDGGDGGEFVVEVSSSSSSLEEDDCSLGMDRSFVSIFDASPETPGLYYGEDGVGEWSIVSIVPIEVSYSSIPFMGELPEYANIFWDGVVVASIFYPPTYIGELFAIKLGGEVRCSVLFVGDIHF